VKTMGYAANHAEVVKGPVLENVCMEQWVDQVVLLSSNTNTCHVANSNAQHIKSASISVHVLLHVAVVRNSALEPASMALLVTWDVQWNSSLACARATMISVVCIICKIIIVCTIYILAHFEACNDFGACSVTCGGGVQQCLKKCVNGNIGDAGCPKVDQIRTQSCSNKQCRKFP